MFVHRWFSRRSATALALLAPMVVSGCATDPIGDSLWYRRAETSGTVGDAKANSKVEALMRVAAASATAGDIGGAAGLYRRAYALDPKNPEPLVQLARMLAGAGVPLEAADAYREALKLDPANVQALRGLGGVLLVLDQPELAVGHLEAALARKQDAETFNALGYANDLLGRHREAQAYYVTGLTETPDSLALRNNLGLSLAFSHDFGKALDELRRVVADRRADARHRLNLALVYGLTGDYEAARKASARDLDPISIDGNIAYYATLRSVQDSRQLVRSIGAHVRAQASHANAMVPVRPAGS